MTTPFVFSKIKKRSVRKYLQQLQKIKRAQHHPLIHKIHHVHKISKKTLFYIKEYGVHSNVPKTIIKESLMIVLLASLLSSFGGLALEKIKFLFLSMMPLIILLPALNDMVGDYGTIVASRFSTMLHKGQITKRWWKEKEVQILFLQVMFIASLTALFSAVIALVITALASPRILPPPPFFALKIVVITLVDVLSLVALLFITTIFAGLYYFKKKEDPNNFLIPITTSVADFGNMIILTALILLFF